MMRLASGILVALVVLAASSVATLAQPKPEFQLGFKALAEQIPDLVGEPLVDEYWGDDGNSLQMTSRGLLVWRKADNWTAFTNGSQTWVNGSDGVVEYTLEARLDHEKAAPASTPAPVASAPATPTAQVVTTPATPTAPAVPTPAAPSAPPASPVALPRITWGNPNVIQGLSVYSNTVWILGEVRNEDTIPAYGVTVSGRLITASESVAGAETDKIEYIGPGDSVGYQIQVKSPAPYVRVEVSASGSANPSVLPYFKVNVSNTALRKSGSAGDETFHFAGVVTNSNDGLVKGTEVRVWFVDAQGKVVDLRRSYASPSALPPRGTTNFDMESLSAHYNPKAGSITRGKAYASGYMAD